jgi:hypothetical protein
LSYLYLVRPRAGIEISGADYGVLVEVEDGEGDVDGEVSGVTATFVSAIT